MIQPNHAHRPESIQAYWYDNESEIQFHANILMVQPPVLQANEPHHKHAGVIHTDDNYYCVPSNHDHLLNKLDY